MELFEFEEIKTLLTNVHHDFTENKGQIFEEYDEMDDFLETLTRVKEKVAKMGDIDELKKEVGSFGWDLMTVLITLQDMANEDTEFTLDQEALEALIAENKES